MNNTNSRINISLFGGLFSILLVLTGMLGKVELKYANIDRLLVFGTGVMFVGYMIERKHNITELIDSQIGDMPGMETEYHAVSRKISLSIILIVLILMLTSIWAIGGPNYRTFTLALATGGFGLGILGGRLLNGAPKERKDSWSSYDKDQKITEYMQLKSWLEGNSSSSLSFMQMEKINQQRSLFIEEIQMVIQSNRITEQDLEDIYNAEFMNEQLLRGLLIKAHNEWLVDALDYINNAKISQFRQLLGSLLMLPVKIELLDALCTPGKINYDSKKLAELFTRLLRDCEDDTIRLQGAGFISHQVDERLQVQTRLFDEDANHFVLFIALKSRLFAGYDFSYPWLHQLRVLVEVYIDSASESANLQPVEFPRWLEHLTHDEFPSWCYCLSELLQDRHIGMSDDVPSHVLDIIDGIQKLKTGRMSRDLIQLTWLAYKQLS